jgi:arginyl-tRNA--protein-N-Asp/Glu arginylyltransferase
MVKLSEQQISEPSECPYLPDRQCRFDHFFAISLSDIELEQFLSRGWRKFGPYYFCPRCENCAECVPIRISATNFIPSKSHRRNLRTNSDIDVRFSPLEYRDEIYDLYAAHSSFRFGKVQPKDGFLESFYMPSCPSMQSEFHLNGSLVAVGFLDKSYSALSTVYFVYSPEVAVRGMGIFGMLMEIEYAHNCGLAFYYPGYYIKENSRMNYKNRFHPCQYYDWVHDRWIDEGEFHVTS